VLHRVGVDLVEGHGGVVHLHSNDTEQKDERPDFSATKKFSSAK
jgi:hypothetical protein